MKRRVLGLAIYVAGLSAPVHAADLVELAGDLGWSAGLAMACNSSLDKKIAACLDYIIAESGITGAQKEEMKQTYSEAVAQGRAGQSTGATKGCGDVLKAIPGQPFWERCSQ